MQKGIVVLGVIVLLIIGVFAFQNKNPKGEMAQTDVTTETNSVPVENTEAVKKDSAVTENMSAPEQAPTTAPQQIGS